MYHNCPIILSNSLHNPPFSPSLSTLRLLRQIVQFWPEQKGRSLRYDKNTVRGQGGEQRQILTKGEPRRQQLGPNVEKLWQRQRHKKGLHSAEEIEQLITSHKRKHNEMPPPPPAVLTVQPLFCCSRHTHTCRTARSHTKTHTDSYLS